VDETDVAARYAVVRVADEVVVDLMALACGIDYEQAAADAETIAINDIGIRLKRVESGSAVDRKQKAGQCVPGPLVSTLSSFSSWRWMMDKP
jgi:hypothetical protein